MAKKHFSLPSSILDWLEAGAKKAGMRRSQFLAHLLMKLMEQERQK